MAASVGGSDNTKGENLGLYSDKLMEYIIGEDIKIKRTKGEKDKTKPLGVGHLSKDKPKKNTIKKNIIKKMDFSFGLWATVEEIEDEDGNDVWEEIMEDASLQRELHGVIADMLDKESKAAAIIEPVNINDAIYRIQVKITSVHENR